MIVSQKFTLILTLQCLNTKIHRRASVSNILQPNPIMYVLISSWCMTLLYCKCNIVVANNTIYIILCIYVCMYVCMYVCIVFRQLGRSTEHVYCKVCDHVLVLCRCIPIHTQLVYISSSNLWLQAMYSLQLATAVKQCSNPSQGPIQRNERRGG